MVVYYFGILNNAFNDKNGYTFSIDNIFLKYLFRKYLENNILFLDTAITLHFKYKS